ncbi:MAG: vitamin B12-dependent ribonucleotide reductase [Candidatus Brocadiia bacterium]
MATSHRPAVQNNEDLHDSANLSFDFSNQNKTPIAPKFNPNALTVLYRRYLMKDAEGKTCETPEGMLHRVAKNITAVEKNFNPNADLKKWENTFYDIMARLWFVPNSPTLMNAGRELQQLSACFVLPVGDSIDSIFEVVKNAALIHKSGGGTGFSFTNIRPKNDLVSTSHGLSSGPISFMKVFNEATEAINQGGFRRGANMAILNYNHPDIMEFVTCKQDEKQLNNFNISIGITEEFMKLVENDEEYDLVSPRNKKPVCKIKARKVFDLVTEKAWQSGEPGIVFMDRLNKYNPTPNAGMIESTNPCGEQPLLPYESCNLGSINLAQMVSGQSSKPEVDWDRIRKVTHLATRFLDNVIEANKYPLPMIEKMTKSNRKIGLGIMGWADMLIQLDIPYNSELALTLAEEVMKFIDTESKVASRQLAVERGAFPNFRGSVYDKRSEPPIRNATTTTIAPTGTISIIAGASSGIEPLYAVCYTRNVMDGTKMLEAHPIFEAMAKKQGFHSEALMKKIASSNSIQNIEEIPREVREVFITAHDVAPEWHIKMQAAFQKYTDNAVSKTVNFRNEATREQVAEVYFLAYKLGCKGVTVYRDGSRGQQVLSTTSETTAKQTTDPEAEQAPFSAQPRPRAEIIFGSTRKVKTGCGNLYVTINYDENGRPFELFSAMGKAGGCAASQTEGLSRLVSFALRSGADIKEVVKQLKGISCHSTSWGKGGKILSCADAISKALEESTNNGWNGPAASTASPVKPETRQAPAPAKPQTGGTGRRVTKSESLKKGACPDCGGILSYEEGCMVCHDCGYSECG